MPPLSSVVRLNLSGDIPEHIPIIRRQDMALSGKYGKLNIPRVGEDEPIFILRAQDQLAETTIEVYRSLLASLGSPLAKNLQKEIDAFRRWSGTKKIPD